MNSYKSPKIGLFLIVALIVSVNCFSQSIAINTDDSPPDPSSILDIKSNNSGLLIPRMAGAQRIGISSPATGLVVFDSDTKSFWFYSGSSWIEIVAAGSQLLSLKGDTLSLSKGNELRLYDHPLIMTGTLDTERQIKKVGHPVDSLDAVNVKSIQKNKLVYNEATGGPNSFELNIFPEIDVLEIGMEFMFKSNQNITGPTTLNINNLGPIPLKQNVNEDLNANEIVMGQMIKVIYDGVNYQVISVLQNPKKNIPSQDSYCFTCDGF